MHLLFFGIRWAVAIPAALVFALCLFGNWAAIVGLIVAANRAGPKRPISLILPGIGPLLGSTFFLVVPLAGPSHWFWLPIVVDPCILIGAWSVLVFAFKRLAS